MRVAAPSRETYAEAAHLIRGGGVVAHPTETVYGLATDPFSESAVEALFHVKGRESRNPILLIVADEHQLAEVVREITPAARRCIDAFWPGPLTLLFPKAAGLPDTLTAGQDRIAVRCPACAIARDLCAAYGRALTSTSANRSGCPPATRVQEIDLEGVALAIDGGALPESAPSTLLDPESGRILRAGALPEETLRRVIG